jgi:serine protease Do
VNGTRFASFAFKTWLGRLSGAVALCAVLAGPLSRATSADVSFAESIRRTQPKVVKVFGAGGFRGLEPYQSGFLISDDGLVVTVSSYVLDADQVDVTLDDGRMFSATLLGADPRLELAVLKIDASGLDHFNLAESVAAEGGTRVLAFSNLFGVATGGEPVSVLHGVVSARTLLSARRGVFDTLYRGPVYVIDAVTNNPGAAGGALTDRSGRLLGLLGKELKNSQNNTWLSYAIPIDIIAPTVEKIVAGEFQPPAEEALVDRPEKPAEGLSADLLGLVLVPNVLERTPPFVEVVRPGSPAERAGLRADDLVLFVNDRLISSIKTLAGELEMIDRREMVKLTVVRDQDLLEFELSL